MNFNLFNQCNMINIIWIDRGIILTIIYYILKYYNELLNKTIIINNNIYRKFISKLFPDLVFYKFTKHNSRNFYFNIRETIRNQDIFIDYMKKYEKNVNAKKIKLVPWYDMNDPLIAYKYEKKQIDITRYKLYINQIFICKRGNYYNTFWDIYMEYNILMKYCSANSIPFNYIYNMLNNYLYKYYIHVKNINIVEKPVVYYEEKQPDKVIVDNNNDINGLIRVMTIKMNKINNLI